MTPREREDIGREMLRQSAFVRLGLIRRGMPKDVAEDIAANAVVLLCASLARGLALPDEPKRRAKLIRACLERSAFALNGRRRRYTDPLRRARVELVDVDTAPDEVLGTVTTEGMLEARSTLRTMPASMEPRGVLRLRAVHPVRLRRHG